MTTPTFSLPAEPSFRADSSTASAQARGFTPPAFDVTLIPRRTMSGSMRSIAPTKSRA